MATLVSHPACGKTWKQRGNRTGHCSKCHETFEGLSLFDSHQRIGDNGSVTCRDPHDPNYKYGGQNLRLVDGTWRGPAMPKGLYGSEDAA